MESLHIKLNRLFALLAVAAASLMLNSTVSATKSVPESEITNTVGMSFVYVPPGMFLMGSPIGERFRHKDESQHKVFLTNGFYIQTTEVTQEQYQKVMKTNPSIFKKCGGDCPVENVSWNDTQIFIKRLNSMENTDAYHLPTEAQWEYACRAGSTTAFHTGDCLPCRRANYNCKFPYGDCPKGKFRNKSLPVATFPPNAWGIFDMHGNVWEWCSDWYANEKYPEVSKDPTGPFNARYKVIRGGSWNFMAHDSRSANRDRSAPNLKYDYVGFRLVYVK